MKRKIIAGGVALVGLFGLWVAAIYLAGLIVKSKVPVTLAPLVFVDGDDSFATATGTWTLEGEKSGFPLQTTIIRCWHEENRCSAATAAVMSGDMLDASLEEMEIQSWQNGQVTFSSEALCTTYTYVISIPTQSATGVRHVKPSMKNNKLCEGLVDEFRMRMVSGFEVQRQLEDNALPWWGKLVALPFRLLD